MNKIRQPAVAGSFYPADPKLLHKEIAQYLNDAQQVDKVPKAIIAPHAGYQYSGPVAASAYVRLQQARHIINQVILIGPTHRVGFKGLAVSSADSYLSPLGNVRLDKQAIKNIAKLPFVHYLDQAHEAEHSLEVHLPFLQEVLADFTLLPIVAGDTPADQVSQVLEQLWGGAETLLVISSDLSHFHDYKTAQLRDLITSEKIQKLQYEQLDLDSACGRIPISGLLALARKKSLTVKTIDLRNSGDTAGDKKRVVGYGAYVIE